MVVDPAFWEGKRVLLTGHTGFKGSWLSIWLNQMGARVSGYALPPETTPNMYDLCRIPTLLIAEELADLRDLPHLIRFVEDTRPEIVIHLAAQSLVRRSYRDPLETLTTNIIGTANVLEACRSAQGLKAVINVTSDKCYANDEGGRAFVETDPMGGHDIYSASKGAAELIAHAYQQSFLGAQNIPMASVRAGNVIGGGDWAEDRLVPDYFRALEAGKPLHIRSPLAVRPWQHVLEPLSGYLSLAERLYDNGHHLCGGWNFGPGHDSVRTVQWIVDQLVSINGGQVTYDESPQPAEAKLLSLNSSKAHHQLGWSPRWTIEQALEHTSSWETERRNGKDMTEQTRNQIAAYLAKETPA